MSIDWPATLKLFHLLAAAVLLGLRLAGGWSLARAGRSGNPAVIAHAARGAFAGEMIFTAPAVVVQLLTGLALADLHGLPLSTPWLVAALAVFIAVGVLWVPLCWLEYRIAVQARAWCRDRAAMPASLARSFTAWHLLEWAALAGVIVLFWLMVDRPGGA